MKGLFLTPKSFKTHIVWGENLLGKMLEKNMGFKLVWADDYDPEKIKREGYDVVVTFKSPQHSCPTAMKSLINLDRSIKLISYYRDVHYHSNPDRYLTNMKKMLERADRVICSYDEGFRSRWPDYIYKYEWLPGFFAPHERYANLPYNKTPSMKGLLVGAIYRDIYPLRKYVSNLNHPYIERLEYTASRTARVEEDRIGDDYASKLNEYFCCVTDASKFRMLVAKYFEIPAAGALLLADEPAGDLVPENPGGLKKLGMISGQHYIKVNKDNFISVIEDVIENPDKYERIRQEGRRFVLENFSIRNSCRQLERIIKEVLRND